MARPYVPGANTAEAPAGTVVRPLTSRRHDPISRADDKALVAASNRKVLMGVDLDALNTSLEASKQRMIRVVAVRTALLEAQAFPESGAVGSKWSQSSLDELRELARCWKDLSSFSSRGEEDLTEDELAELAK